MNCPTCGSTPAGRNGFTVELTVRGQVRIALTTGTNLAVTVTQHMEQTDFLNAIKPILCTLGGPHKDGITDLLPPKNE